MNENKARSRLDQRRAPIYEALERFRQMRVVRGGGREQHEAPG